MPSALGVSRRGEAEKGMWHHHHAGVQEGGREGGAITHQQQQRPQRRRTSARKACLQLSWAAAERLGSHEGGRRQ